MNELTFWLVLRLQWVYGFLVRDLHFPSKLAYGFMFFLVGLFFYELYDLFTQRHKGNRAAIWLAVVLLVPLGTIIYIAYGQRDLHNAPTPLPPPPLPPQRQNSNLPPGTPGQQPANIYSVTSNAVTRNTATTLGTIVGIIAMVAGVIALGIFILIVLAFIQCANDPKCM